VVGFSSIPYVAALTVGISQLPFLEKLTGSGQLLLTSVALLGSALRDTVTWNHMPRVKEVTVGLSFLALLGIAMFYVRIINTVGPLGATYADPQQLHDNAVKSVILYCITWVTAFGLTIVGTPPKGVTDESPVKGEDE
jgi:hypothetical protein